MAISQERVLLSGASGLVGHAVLQQLAAQDIPTLALCRNPAVLDTPNIQTAAFHLDAITKEHVRAIKDFAPSVVIHAAWMGTENTNRNAPENIEINIAASLCVFEMTAATCRRWITFGSQAEYAPGIVEDIAETARCAPDSAYGAGKVELEKKLHTLCAEKNIAFTWLRLFTLYGPRSKPSYIIPTLIENFRAGTLPVLRAPHMMLDWLHADDAAEAVLKLLVKENARGLYNLASGIGLSVAEVAMTLAELMDFSHIPELRDALNANTTSSVRRVADSDKFKREFSWQPTIGLRAGLLSCL